MSPSPTPHQPHEPDPFAGVLDEDWPNTEVKPMPDEPISTDRVEQFERVIDTLDEQPQLTDREWIELLEKVKFEVDSRLALARAGKRPA